MDVEHIYWMQEHLVADSNGKDEIRIFVSYDNGRGRVPQFFRVPEADVTQARTLYKTLGGFRDSEYRQGNTVKVPGIPFIPSIRIWRENG